MLRPLIRSASTSILRPLGPRISPLSFLARSQPWTNSANKLKPPQLRPGIRSDVALSIFSLSAPPKRPFHSTTRVEGLPLIPLLASMLKVRIPRSIHEFVVNYL